MEPKGDRMSRTDKTRPWWVKMNDAPMVTCAPRHDHRFGPCTLPDEITAETASASHRTSGCYWGSTGHNSSGPGVLHNGCRDCTGYYDRREDRRRSRRAARLELRNFHSEGW